MTNDLGSLRITIATILAFLIKAVTCTVSAASRTLIGMPPLVCAKRDFHTGRHIDPSQFRPHLGR